MREIMKSEKECCGTCRWHQHESIDYGWVCVNEESDYFTDWTEYDDYCEEWEHRDDAR